MQEAAVGQEQTTLLKCGRPGHLGKGCRGGGQAAKLVDNADESAGFFGCVECEDGASWSVVFFCLGSLRYLLPLSPVAASCLCSPVSRRCIIVSCREPRCMRDPSHIRVPSSRVCHCASRVAPFVRARYRPVYCHCPPRSCGAEPLGSSCARQHTVRDGALENAYKKSAGDLGPDFLAQIRNQGGRPGGPQFLKMRRRRRKFHSQESFISDTVSSTWIYWQPFRTFDIALKRTPYHWGLHWGRS